MDDPHYARYPADDKGGDPILPGRVDSSAISIQHYAVISSILTELKDEVEALEEVSDGVPKADEDVEEEDPDDSEGCNCLQERTLVILVLTVATPVACITFWSNLRKRKYFCLGCVPLFCTFFKLLFLFGRSST